jgi:hypothetical protein
MARRRDASNTPDRATPASGFEADLLARTLHKLDAEILKWRGRRANVRAGDRRFTLDLDELERGLTRPLATFFEGELVALVADALNVRVDDRHVQEYEVVRPLLRPRLLTPDILNTPARSLCRRQAMAGLLHAVSIGRRTTRTFVTPALLDRWGVSFEAVATVAADNLFEHLSVDDLTPLDDEAGVVELRRAGEPGSAASLSLELLIPGILGEGGVLVAMPEQDVTLLMPVQEGMGAGAIATMLRATDAAASRAERVLSRRVYWLRDDRVDAIDATIVEAERSRKAVVESRGPVAELLALLEADDDDDEDGLSLGVVDA